MSDKYVAYVGTYTRGESEGLYILDTDVEYGLFRVRPHAAFHINNPSYLRLSHDGRFLYTSCDEGVASFRILEDGGLELMNKASVNGLRPCYLSVDRENHFLLSAGYHDGKLTVLKLAEDGTIEGVCDEVFMKSLGSASGMNFRCHVNCALFTPDENYALAVDLGTDQVKIYKINRETGKIKLHDILHCELKSGPKHMIFSSDGKFAFLTHENSCQVSMYAYDSETAHFTKLDQLSTLPEDFGTFNSAITLRLTSDDAHLFVSNTGNNSVAVYNVDKENRMLKKSCILPISGEYPRDIVVMPGDQVISCVNQEGNSITSFRMKYEADCFVMTGPPVSIPSPTCMVLKKLD